MVAEAAAAAAVGEAEAVVVDRVRTLLSLLVAIVAMAWPTWACAEVSITSYVLTVRPQGPDQRTHFALTLTYRAVGETKREGFKYVGSSSIDGVVAHTEAGAPLEVKASYEAKSGESRIDFHLPPPDAQGLQTVVVELDQVMPSSYALSGEVGVIDWASQFRVPIGTTTLRVVGPKARGGSGLSCRGMGSETVCERSGQGIPSFVTRVPLGPPKSGALVLWGITASGGALLLAHAYRRRRRDLLALRGVLPPAAEVAYPEAPEGGYRVPPPLPTPETTEPVLSEDDRTSLGFKTATAFVIYGLAQVLVAVFATASVEIGLVLAIVAIGVAIPLAVWLPREKAPAWFITSIIAAVFLYAAFTFQISALGMFFTLLGCGMVFLVIVRPNLGGGAGGTSSSYSSSTSSCSSSSCGGGGGSSCGGGGGGGGCGG